MASGTLENQPYYLRRLLDKEKKTEQPDVLEEASGVQPTRPLKNRADLLGLVNESQGRGVIIDEAIADSYPTARKDIASLISERVVRHIRKHSENTVLLRKPGAKLADSRNQKSSVQRLRACTYSARSSIPWQRLFHKYGVLTLPEFLSAIRTDIRLPQKMFSDAELTSIFQLFENREQRGQIVAKEFAEFMDEPDNFPIGNVLYARFEREVEVVQLDEDVRAAFHGVKAVHAGDSGAKVALAAPKPAKKVRRTSTRQTKNFVNSHMDVGD
mmetsp:Transcript_45810/g.88141  ORF Transcript_45810/g.88141 Transcript_45810/m.88141 type:complete len:271 (-) Transcript_45810:174-986(-)